MLVIDKNKINYNSPWTKLLDRVTPKEALENGFRVSSNWLTDLPDNQVRHISDNLEKLNEICRC